MIPNIPITTRLMDIREALIMGKVNTERYAGVIPQVFPYEDITEYEDFVYNRLDRINEALKLMEGVIMDVVRMEANSWKN